MADPIDDEPLQGGKGGDEPSDEPSPPTPPQEPPTPPSDDGDDPYLTFGSKEAFDARMQQAVRAELRQHGISDPAEIEQILADKKKREEEESERRRAELSELERVQEDLRERDERIAQLEAEQSDLEFNQVISDVCAEHGVKNRGYAAHLIMLRAAEVPDDEEFSASEYIASLMEDDEQRAALGAPTVTAPKGATTEPGATTGGKRPTPPPAGGSGDGPVDAMNLSKQELKELYAREGIEIR